MSKGTRGAVLAPPIANDPLPTIGGGIEHDLDYFSLMAEAGAYRVPGQGIKHKLPIGQPYFDGKTWRQQTKAYPVAMSTEEARELTRATGERHDYFEPGTVCKRCAEVAGAGGVLSGWVLGGRKFQAEHAHVTDFDPTVYDSVEVAAPMSEDEPLPVDPAAVAVEA